MTRGSRLAIAAGAALTLGGAGWAAAGALLPAPAVAVPAGGALQVRYEVRRELAYVPPPPTDATRLEVMDAQSPTVIEDGVLSAQAVQALRSLQAEDDARSAAAVAAIRAEDARIDRDSAAASSAARGDPSDDAIPGPARSAG